MSDADRWNMNEDERWIYFDGPEPKRLRPLLDALRDLPPATQEEKDRAVRRFLAKLDARLAAGKEGPRSDPPDASSAPMAPPDAERQGAEDGATVQSPPLAAHRDTPPEE